MSNVSKRTSVPTPHADEGPIAAVSVRPVVCTSLAAVGIAMSTWAFQFARPDGPLLYWGILPGAPFVLLAAVGFFPRVPVRVILGAAAGALLTTAVPYGWLLYESKHYSGGGANIGLGLLLLATPVFLPIAMLLGAAVTLLWGRRRRGIPKEGESPVAPGNRPLSS